jgi:hypothetical protein
VRTARATLWKDRDGKVGALGGVQYSVVLNGLQCLVERQASIEAKPSSRMAVPQDVETIAAGPVQSSKRSIKFFAEVLRVT